LASTGTTPRKTGHAWASAGLRYYPLRLFLQERFGGRVDKVSVDAAFGCPNRDGTLGVAGCVFCNPAAYSPSRRHAAEPVARQIDLGLARLARRRRVDRVIAYFQPGTNTYAPPARLRAIFGEALAHPAVVGLAVGTRPDCLGDDVLDLLAELAQRTWVSLELGLQSIHDRSLEWLGRGHRYDAFLAAVGRSRGRGLHLAAHVILALPGESREDMIATADELTRLRIDAVKLHQLHAVRDTPLADQLAAGRLRLPERDEYVACVVDFLEHLWPGCVIDRLVGDAPAEYLVGPDWCRDKSQVLRAIDAELRRRNTQQGRLVPLASEPA